MFFSTIIFSTIYLFQTPGLVLVLKIPKSTPADIGKEIVLRDHPRSTLWKSNLAMGNPPTYKCPPQQNKKLNYQFISCYIHL